MHLLVKFQTNKRTSFIYNKIFKASKLFLKSSNNSDEDNKVNVKTLKYVFIMYQKSKE